jgi:hypothetical protein
VGGFVYSSLQKQRKLKTGKDFKPPKNLVGVNELNRFYHLSEEWINRADSLLNLDANNIKLQSPIGSIIKFKLGEVVAINSIHTKNHLNQALRVKNDPRFPK